jgi:hypothetical protein
MVVVIILIVLTLILGVWATGLWAEYKQRERQSTRLKQILDVEIPAKNEETKARMRVATEASGFQLVEEKPDTNKANEFLKQKRAEYWDPANYNKYPLVPSMDDKGNVTKRPDDLNAAKVSEFSRARDESTVNGSLQELVRIATARAFHYKTRMDQLDLELKIAQEQVNNRKDLPKKLPEQPRRKKEEILKEITGVTQMIAAENTQYNERKANFAKQKTDAEAETASEVAKWAEEEIKMINETRELRRQMEELKVKEVIKHEIAFVHGKIMRPDIPNKVAFIDIGSRDRVVPGLKFLVGRRGSQHKFEYKAKVEVKKCWMTYCEVAILDVFNPKEHPVTDGDYIVNPLFSKDRPIVVAFVGEEHPVKLRYSSTDEAARRIQEIGSVVKKDVALDLDFVIFTETKGKDTTRDHYEAYKKAVFLEIPIAEAGRTKEEPDRPGLFEFLTD